MPRNGSGAYSRTTAGYVYNTVIDEVAVNAEMDDIAAALTASLAKDGQTTPTANLPMGTYRHTGVGNGSARTDYAAMGQVQDGKINWVDGGGTADAITAIYSPAITALVDGQLCCVRATAANATTTPTFAPNGLTARTIVKKGGAALVAGDIVGDGHELILRYDLTNTRWELLNPGSYAGLGANTFTGTQTINAQLRGAAKADVASAATIDLTAVASNVITITGTAAISAVTMTDGTWVFGRFASTASLVHGASLKVHAGGANFTAAADDSVLFFQRGTVVEAIPFKADGTAVVADTQKIAQVVNTQTGAVTTGTTTIPLDDTVPQNTEGNEYMTLAITPTNAGSTLLVEVVAFMATSAAGVNNMQGALFQDSTANAIASAVELTPAANAIVAINFNHKMTAGTTSPTTFKFRAGLNGAGTTTFNGYAGGRVHGGVLASSITITEILP